MWRQGNVALLRGQFSEAQSAYERSLRLAIKLHDQFPTLPQLTQELARRHAGSGKLLSHRKDFAAAALEYRKAADLAEGLHKKYPRLNSYRYEAALPHIGLGMALRKLNRRADALKATRRSITHLEPLVKSEPENAAYQYNLGAALGNWVVIIREKSSLKEISALQQRAIGHLRKAYTLRPHIPVYRTTLRKNLSDHSFALALMLRHDEAMRVCDEIAGLSPPLASNLITAAQRAAHLSGMVPKDERISTREREALSKKYADKAMQFLKSAIDRGLPNAARVAADPMLGPLRHRADFQRLIRDVKAAPR